MRSYLGTLKQDPELERAGKEARVSRSFIPSEKMLQTYHCTASGGHL